MTALARHNERRWAAHHFREGGGVSLEQDERYTRDETLHQVAELTGIERFDLDVAACHLAHVAARYFTRQDDGLSRLWKARYVWCNPPYSDIEPWVLRTWDALSRGECSAVVMLLPASRTEQPWWQALVEPWRDKRPRKLRGRRFELRSHFLPGRTRFGNPRDPKGYAVGSPPFCCVLLTFARPGLLRPRVRALGHGGEV